MAWESEEGANRAEWRFWQMCLDEGMLNER
jgi:hypothetical protein